MMTRTRWLVLVLVSCAGAGAAAACGGADSNVDLGSFGSTDAGGETGDVRGSGEGGKSDGGAADGAVGADSSDSDGSTPSDPLIACVDRTCSLAQAQVCCVTRPESSPPPFVFACAASGACPSGGNGSVALACASGVNCGGASPVCCLTKGGNGGQSACKAACGASEARLCNPTGGTDCAGTCSSNNIGGWGLPSTYATCGGVLAP